MTVMITLNYKDYDGCRQIVQQFNASSSIDVLIIVDNLSGDGSYEKLKEFESTSVFVIETGKNGGYSFGYNFGIKYASKFKPDFIIVCNSDIIFNEVLLKECTNYLNETPSCGAVSARQFSINGEEQLSAWRYPNYWDEIKFCFFAYRKNIGRKNRIVVYDNESRSIRVDALSGCFTCFNANALFESGLYDENVFLYNEENIISKRLQQIGYFCARLNCCSYIHAHKRKRNVDTCNLLRLYKRANCSYYFQSTYNDISFWENVLLKMCVMYEALELCIINTVKKLLGGQNEKHKNK